MNARSLGLSTRSLVIIGASGILSGVVIYVGTLSIRIALFGGLMTVIGSALALRPADTQKRSGRDRRRDAMEMLSRRITPSTVEVVPSDLRLGTQRSLENVQRERQVDAVRAYLRMVREATSFEEVVFWRADSVGNPLEPSAWSSAFTEPPEFTEGQRSTVDWAADARLIITDGREPPELVAGPVGSGTLLYGVLSFRRGGRLVDSTENSKKWMERASSHLALLVELLEMRIEFQRQRQHSQALLRAAYKIQSHSSTDSLGPAICETALEVTSASRSALISWDHVTMEGKIESVSAGHPVPEGFRVSEGSLVGQMCSRGLPMVKEDLRARSSKAWVYGEGEPRRDLGSIGIVPLKQEEDVIGAVVIEGDVAGDVVMAEVRHVSLLAAVASTSLQISWKMEEASKRARTDQLTGLANRRHFDEQLTRVLLETDRFGNSASLILADLDFFKKVNDTHGHDAGDAVLRHVAATFMEGVRAIDLCARYGGEELALLLPQTDPAGAAELAERLRAMLESRPVRYGRTEIRVTASFGVASYPDSAPQHDSFFPAADKALYQAKAQGRNCVRVAPITATRRAT